MPPTAFEQVTSVNIGQKHREVQLITILRQWKLLILLIFIWNIKCLAYLIDQSIGKLKRQWMFVWRLRPCSLILWCWLRTWRLQSVWICVYTTLLGGLVIGHIGTIVSRLIHLSATRQGYMCGLKRESNAL